MNIFITEYHESMDALIFQKYCLEYCENKPAQVMDCGPWYLWTAKRLGLEHHIVSGDEGNFIERGFETLRIGYGLLTVTY